MRTLNAAGGGTALSPTSDVSSSISSNRRHVRISLAFAPRLRPKSHSETHLSRAVNVRGESFKRSSLAQSSFRRSASSGFRARIAHVMARSKERLVGFTPTSFMASYTSTARAGPTAVSRHTSMIAKYVLSAGLTPAAVISRTENKTSSMESFARKTSLHRATTAASFTSRGSSSSHIDMDLMASASYRNARSGSPFKGAFAKGFGSVTSSFFSDEKSTVVSSKSTVPMNTAFGAARVFFAPRRPPPSAPASDSSSVPMNRAIVAASGSTLAAIASAAAADEGATLFGETLSEAPSFFLGARRRFFPRRLFGSPPADGTSAPPPAARAGAAAPRALPTTPRTPPAPSNRGDEARTGLRATSRATADGFGVRLPDPDATGANARASVAIAREEERSASPASRPLRARAVRRGFRGRSSGVRRPRVVLARMATSACASRQKALPWQTLGTNSCRPQISAPWSRTGQSDFCVTCCHAVRQSRGGVLSTSSISFLPSKVGTTT